MQDYSKGEALSGGAWYLAVADIGDFLILPWADSHPPLT